MYYLDLMTNATFSDILSVLWSLIDNTITFYPGTLYLWGSDAAPNVRLGVVEIIVIHSRGLTMRDGTVHANAHWQQGLS